MPTVTLTARSVASLKATDVQTEYWDEILTNFGLRVGAGGARTFTIRYRVNGKYKRLTIGKHPAMSLADAREAAKAKLLAVQAGEDPAADDAQRKRNDATFRALADEVLAAKAGEWREKTRVERKRIVESELIPAWGDMPAAAVARRDVLQLLERIAKRAPVMANRTLATVRMIYNVGLDRQFPALQSNPAHRLKPIAQEAGRSRYLSRDELRIVWQLLDDESVATRVIFRLTMLTAARVGSVCSMRWADISDADVWTIPASAFKGHRPMLVPLSKQALAVLEELRPLTGEGEHVFPGRGKAHRASINKALQRVRERSELPNWTIHDFRTTFRTHATRAANPAHKNDPKGLGIAPAVADAALGHKEKSLGYDRYTGDQTSYLLSEKRDALKKWGAFVARAVKDGAR